MMARTARRRALALAAAITVMALVAWSLAQRQNAAPVQAAGPVVPQASAGPAASQPSATTAAEPIDSAPAGAGPPGADPATSFVPQAVEITRARFRDRPGERLAVANLAVAFGDLARRAEAGDLEAARALFEDLRSCTTSPRDAASYERRIANEKARYAERGGSGEQHAITLAVTAELYRHCAGVTEAQLQQLGRYGQQLADAGDVNARLGYLWDARPQAGDGRLAERLPPFRERGLQYLRTELDRGNPRALFSLSSAYADPGLGIQDPRRQYVYGYAYAQTPGLNPYDAVYVGLADLEQRLSSADIAALQREAIALYLKCCGR
jgi:hypothetical protein